MKKLILSTILCMFTMMVMTSLAFASDVNIKNSNAQKAAAVLQSLETGDKIAISSIINKYAQSIDLADTQPQLASEIWQPPMKLHLSILKDMNMAGRPLEIIFMGKLWVKPSPSAS